ncbi:MAG: di-trans,poly-cis-decaprenylcistransferase [Spirochaetaceae bacterium]|nr:MAG: di-trans,poly-cis-decaprenylcistransferase [Spirochaetaceae bacterium]
MGATPVAPAGAVPTHVGIIMDGNGRWATARNLPRTNGHQEGLEAAKRIVRAAADLGCRYLSLYAFSTENWNRTPDEVKFLMGLVGRHLRKELPFYTEVGVRIVHSGDTARLPKSVQTQLAGVMEDTAGFNRITVNLALNYGGRDEIVRAVGRVIEGDAASGATPCGSPVTEERLRGALDLPELPDPDLIIRTGGERRLSNFLLWQCAYAELYFSDKLWPDWDHDDLREAFADYACRTRNFGGVR